jgi:hypothetical protein
VTLDTVDVTDEVVDVTDGVDADGFAPVSVGSAEGDMVIARGAPAQVSIGVR